MTSESKRYKESIWMNWMVLHWMLNPGLAFNELVLGQRIPKLTLEDKESKLPRVISQFVPCPHCATIHDARTWSFENKTAFGNWFGLYCPSCGGIIPCLFNLTSLIIVIATAPLWLFFYKPLKRKWLEKQNARYKSITIDAKPNTSNQKNWVVSGLSWGGIMFLILDVLIPLITGPHPTFKSLAVGFGCWLIAGLAFGFTTKILGSILVPGANKANP